MTVHVLLALIFCVFLFWSIVLLDGFSRSYELVENWLADSGIVWLIGCLYLVGVIPWSKAREWLIRQAILIHQRWNGRIPVENDELMDADAPFIGVAVIENGREDQPNEQDGDAILPWYEYEPIYML